MIEVSTQSTVAGQMRVAVAGERVVGLAFERGWERVERHLVRRFGPDELRPGEGSREVAARLDSYMAGELDALEGLALDPGGTRFQAAAWAAMRRVSPGETISYADLAARAGVPGAVRAAGAACGANPIWLAIPCHRIIGTDGSLRDYGGGLELKAWLLAHEAANRADPSPP